MKPRKLNPTLAFDLDEFWKRELEKPNPPSILVDLEAQLQRAAEAYELAVGEIRDWARMNWRDDA